MVLTLQKLQDEESLPNINWPTKLRRHTGRRGIPSRGWRGFHIDLVQRSHIDKVILLVKLTDDLYVLIKEQVYV